MKKVLFVCLTFLIILAGCSSTNNKTPEASAPSEPKQNAPAAPAANEPKKVKTMKLAIVVPKERSLAKGLAKFGEIVEEKTGGSIKFELYTDGQLGGDRDVFEGLQLGTIQGTSMSTAIIGAFNSKFNVFDLPFLFKDVEQAYTLLDGSIGEEILEGLPELGVIGFNYWENGFRHLTNDVREVKSLADIKGLKIRTLENQLHIDAWSQLGAVPTPMAYTELYTALQQKVVDGQENPYGNVSSAKFYEVQKYLTNTGHIYNASPFLLSKKFWDTLSDEEKEIVTNAADEARDFQREENQKEDIKSIAYVKEQGMIITDLTPEAKAEIQQELQPIYEKYAPSIGKELMDKVLGALK